MTSKSKFGTPDSSMTQIVALLRSTEGVETAKIFGSRAMGNYRDGSDIDIAVVAPSLDHNQYLRLCSKLDDLFLPYKIDLVLIHQVDNSSLIEHIDRVGIELW